MNIDMNIYVYEFLFINWNLSANFLHNPIRLASVGIQSQSFYFINLQISSAVLFLQRKNNCSNS